MANYIVNFTNISATPIEIGEGDINSVSTDISLFGRIRLEYGELLNENLLHVLENYACPEDFAAPGNPDLDTAYGELLANPTQGQFWYNSTAKTLCYWTGTQWVPIRGGDDVAANWGSISHGEQIPRPRSSITGYEFGYDECIWSVAPGAYAGAFSSMRCTTDEQANVTMEYAIQGDSTAYGGVANYLIIGIKGNVNLGSLVAVSPLPDSSPTPTPTMTQTPQATGVTPTPSALTPTPTNSPAPSLVAPSLTPSPTPVVATFGANATLYMSPWPCDPGTPGPGGSAIDTYDTCGIVPKSAYDKSLYVSIQGLDGGVPPYTVDYQFTTGLWTGSGGVTQGIIDFNSNDPNYTGSPGDTTYQGDYSECTLGTGTFAYTFYGGSGAADNKVRTNVSPNEITYIRIRYDSPHFYPGYDYQQGIKFAGFITLTDSVGASFTLYTPPSPAAGYPYPDKMGCPVGGVQRYFNDIIADGGQWILYYIKWRHWGMLRAGYTSACDACTQAIANCAL